MRRMFFTHMNIYIYIYSTGEVEVRECERSQWVEVEFPSDNSFI